MREQYLGKIQKELIELEDNGISQNQLAKQIKVSPATLSNIRNGKFESISEKMARAIYTKLNLSEWKLCPTHNFKVIFQLCDSTRQLRRMVAVAAYPGAGKTEALRKYAKKSGVFYYEAKAHHNKLRFIQGLQRSLGISEGKKAHHMIDAIVAKLLATPNPMLLLDDFAKLSPACFRILQSIYDETEYHTAIVLAGTDALYRTIMDNARLDRPGFRELDSRIAFWQRLKRPTKQEVYMICTENGIQDTGAIAHIAARTNEFRKIRQTITNALYTSSHTQDEVSKEMLEDLAIGSKNMAA